MPKSPYADRATTLLKELGKSPGWVARKLGLNKQSVYNWFEDASPRDESQWPQIIAFLEREVAMLRASQAGEPQLRALEPRSRYPLGTSVILPLLRAHASNDDECYFDEDSQDFQEMTAIVLTGDPEQYRLLQIIGGSASPRINHAELALLRLNPAPPLGALVVCRSPDQRLYLKALKAGTPPIPYELHALHPAFKTIKSVRGWTFVGHIEAIIKSAEPGKANIEFDGGKPLRV